MEDTAGLPDDLHALDAAPRHGLNARALILRAAAAAAQDGADNDDDDDDYDDADAFLPAIGADPARLAEEARAAAVKAGRALGSAWPKTEAPFPDLIRNAKIDRAVRVPVLARLAGEHLALALHARLGGEDGAWAADPVRAVTVLATPGERAAAVAAARTQELALYRECINTGAYRARATRVSALDAGEAEAEAAAAAAPARPAAPLKRSAAEVDPVTDRRAAPNPRPPPRKRAAAAVGAPPPPPPPPVDGDWTATDAGLDPHTAVRACAAGKDLAAHFEATLAPRVAAGKLSAAAAAAGVDSAVGKVLAAHGAAALAGDRAWLDGDGARKRLADFVVACAKTAAQREVRAARVAKAAAWGAARVAKEM